MSNFERGPEYQNILDDLGLKKEEKRTEAEQKELEREIATIARIFSRQYDMDVLPSNQWACGLKPEANIAIQDYLKGKVNLGEFPKETFQPKTITYDRKSLEGEGKDSIIGKVRHEVGHAKHSDYRLLVEGMKHAKDQGYLPTGWASIANSIEDPRINNIEIADSDTVRQKIGALYEGWKKDTVKLIGSQPITRQLGLDIIHYWLTGEEIPTLQNEEVKKVFNEIKPKLDQLFTSTSAQETHETIKKEIWDKYKTLEGKAIDDEELKKMIESAAEDLAKQLQGKEGEGEEGEDQGGGLLSKLREKLGGGKGKESKQSKELSDSLSRQIGSGTKKEIRDNLKKQMEEQKMGESAEGEGEEKEEGLESGIQKDINLDELPQELKDKLRDIANKLPNELKRQLRDEAKRQLDRKQAQALNKQLPKFIKMKKDEKTGQYIPEFVTKDQGELEESKQEVENLKEQMSEEEQAELEKQQQEWEEKARKEREEVGRQREKVEMEKYGFTPEERDHYLKFRELENSMRWQIENFLRILDRYLPKKEEYTYGGEFFTGKKIDFEKLSKKVPIKRHDFFKRREVQESSEAKLYATLLIDNSGSMAGQKMEESLKTAIFFARVLKRFEIPFSVKFFGDHVESIKEFDDDYDDRSKRIKPKLVMLSDASGSSTNISDPLEITEKEMLQAKREFQGSAGIIFVVSDGNANQGRTGEALKSYVDHLQKTYPVSAFGLGAGAAEELKHYFGEHNTAAVEDFSKLPQEAFRVLRVTLERQLRRLRRI